MSKWKDSLVGWLHNAGQAVSRWNQTPALAAAGAGDTGASTNWTTGFVDRILSCYHFTPEAIAWLRREIPVEVVNPASTSGGGFWLPAEKIVRLLTAQDEAAVHELAHAWWHYRRQGQERDLITAVVLAADESDRHYARVQGLARGYVHGIPAQNWPGMLVDNNDWEMFAGLASGTMGDTSLMPPYLRRFYQGLFEIRESW